MRSYAITHDRTVKNLAEQDVVVSVNLRDEVVDTDPDVVFFMLGSNDGVDWAFGGAYYQQRFTDGMTAAFESLAAYVNGRGAHPEVFVAVPPPIRVEGDFSAGWTQEQIDRRAAGAAALINEIAPVVEQGALEYGFHVVDLMGAYQAREDWETLFQDGVHQNEAGRDFIRQEFITAYLSVPEPATVGLLLAGATAMWRRRQPQARRRRAA